MNTFIEPLKELEAFNDIIRKIEERVSPIYITGATDSEKCHLIYAIKPNQSKLIITYNEIRARELYNDMKFFGHDHVFIYPSKDIIFYSADVHSNDIIQERIKIIKKIIEQEDCTVIVTIEALMEKLTPKMVFKQYVLSLQVGEQLDLESMSKQLVFMGYERVGQVESRGQFAIRGGILDLFTLTDEWGIRIELWDNEIDSIRTLNVDSQRSVEKIDQISIYPAKEVVLNDLNINQAKEKIKKDRDTLADYFNKNEKFQEEERIINAASTILEKMTNEKTFSGIEGWINYFYSQTESLLDYLELETLLFFDEPSRIQERSETIVKEFRESVINRYEKGYLLKGQTELLTDLSVIKNKIDDYRCLLISTLLQRQSLLEHNYTIDITVKSVNPYHSSLELLVKDLKYWSDSHYKIILLAGTKTRALRLVQELMERKVRCYYLSVLDQPIKSGDIVVSYGSLNKGFEYPLIKFVIITESNIIGKQKKKKKRVKRSKYKGSRIETFSELKVGDYVVHENYGVGVFRGTEKIEVDGVSKDYIKISYRDGGNLYISTSQLNILQKYIGGEDRSPKLNKLGTNEWNKTKSRVKGAVKDLAEDLVKLYAKRQAKKGFSFDEDSIWQKEFEEMFPYEETDDQLTAIEDTKRDMQSERIMDRLICGDVGYGKTEVAIRAAFKSVQDNKQVAYLVPTTILAQQHYNNFVQRMKDFPVRVEMLSRFKSRKEQKKIIEDNQKGLVDILIGTHRIISKDVVFKDLGLLIIDEEQRFGVVHKEKIKQLKENVDVLTLTATPIPRTLHMSLIGIRDMSVLEEPPLERHPIQTYVLEYNQELIRDAIYREIARDGQVYYVYNRVKKIDEVADRISMLIPEASVAYAHGQMNERELENIMFDFINGDIDILVSTTIIETGLDISNVNTLIVEDADRMGLSQLYQLRGRVGRSNRVAYAYLLYKKDKILQETAEKRLQAIKQFTEFGSGFKIAMRDLEIRGAGNIIGSRQHGHMEAVGYDLYCKLLEQAVHELNDNVIDIPFETTVELSIDAFIPTRYIKDEIRKLEAYKKIASIQNEKDYYEIGEELEDRYGDLPHSVMNLLEIALIKSMANKLEIVTVEQKGENIKFTIKSDASLNPDKIPELLGLHKNQLYFSLDKLPYFTYKLGKTHRKQLFRQIKNVLHDINRLKE